MLKEINKKNAKKIIAALIAGTFVFAACGPAGGVATPDPGPVAEAPADDNGNDVAAPTDVNGRAAPPEGPDTNNGRPFNLRPVAWDDRDASRFLHGINATILPIAEQPVEVEFWRGFGSTIMLTLDESEVFQEAAARTNVTIVWSHPPAGQSADHFNLRIAADDLPHVFIHPPAFPGGNVAAIEQGVYLDLTPFYNMGWMPNFHWLRTGHPEAEEIRIGTTDDLGRITNFPMIDIVPSHPWMGLWIRQDYLDNYGLAAPTTIQEWDHVLRTWRDSRGSWVLQHYFPGVNTCSSFVGSFNARRNWINMDGVAVFGAIEPGFRDYLTLMHDWLADGILDPDFATRTGPERDSNIISGQALAFNMAYGGIGQLLLTGRQTVPEMAVTPLPNPAPYPGARVRISSQNNSIVRGDRSWVTDRGMEDGLVEYVVRLMDYWYSQDGGDLLSYGIPGHASVWNADGEIEWIHPLLDTPDADFWTVVYGIKMRPFPFLRDATAYEMVPEVWECIRVWGEADNSWVMLGEFLAFTPEEAEENASIMVDVNTHVEQQALAFIHGTRPLAEFDDFVAEIEGMNVYRAVANHQAALDRLAAR